VVNVTNSTPETVNRGQRIMAYLIAILVVLSLASFIAVIAGTAMGAGADDGFSQGVWPVVLMAPLFALPSAMLLTIALLIISSASRKKANKAS
jgi:Ni/Fe-hydrogenase subunit HybB-like protein